MELFPIKVVPVDALTQVNIQNFDCLIVVWTSVEEFAALSASVPPIKQIITDLQTADQGFATGLTFLPFPYTKRLILSPTGPTDRDYDDVRRFAEATKAGILRAKAAGAQAPVIFFPQSAQAKPPAFANLVEVSLLAALAALYEPLQAREAKGKPEQVHTISFCAPGMGIDGAKVSHIVSAVEAGRRLARDLGGADPERMTPLRFVEYLSQTFAKLPGESSKLIKLEDVTTPQTLTKDYPLLAAVCRASTSIGRHYGHVVRLEYNNTSEVVAFASEELKKFNGSDSSKPVLMAVKGRVYDVTKGAAFYGAGGRYNIYAGRDAARGLATMSLDAAVVDNPSLEGVSDEDLQTLAEWISKLEAKYPVVGYVSDGVFSAEAKKGLDQAGGANCDALFFAGKGVTYDTGGADVKTGGSMPGMCKDKCGAASVAGFVLVCALLRPKGLRVISELGVVRNSVGSDSYVADEIITGHSGVRVRIGNTDAEGRLVLADLLSHLRLRALTTTARSKQFFSVATLTGHAKNSFGAYPVTLDNGPAAGIRTSEQLQTIGELWGDPFEVSRLRRDDYDNIKPKSSDYDVLSCRISPGPRGHQYATAFLNVASGLSSHSATSAQPLPYSHLDITGGAVDNADFVFGLPTGTPVVALTAKYILSKL